MRLPDSFWSHVNKEGPVPAHAPHLGPCWLWTASRLRSGGYGQCSLRAYGEGRAHRAAYKSLVGPIPGGLELDHLCRVRHCVNPAHLEPVTRRVNFQRGDRAGALGRMHAAKTHCPQGHAYTPENTRIEPQPNGRPGTRRVCRTCNRLRARRAA